MEKSDITVLKMTQDEIGKHQRKAYDDGKFAGVLREHLDLIKMEVTGGPCPRCQKEWQEIHVQNEFADYVYFDPACKCFGRCASFDYGWGACSASFHREESAGITVTKCPSCGWDVDPVFGRVCRDCGESYQAKHHNTFMGQCPACKKKRKKRDETGEF